MANACKSKSKMLAVPQKSEDSSNLAKNARIAKIDELTDYQVKLGFTAAGVTTSAAWLVSVLPVERFNYDSDKFLAMVVLLWGVYCVVGAVLDVAAKKLELSAE